MSNNTLLFTKYRFNTENNSRFKLQFDLQRDKSFIIDQILDLPLNSIETLAGELGLWKDRSFVLTALDIIKFAGLFNNDREVMMAAVREFPNSLLFASNELLDDVEFIKFAILNGVDLRFVHERFKKDRELVLTAIKAVGNNYFTIDENLKNDKEIVMIALEENPTIFTTLSRTLQSDREIILKTVSNFTNLKFDYSGQQDPDIFPSKLSNNSFYSSLLPIHSINYSSIEIVNINIEDDNFISLYPHLPNEFKDDREILLRAIKLKSTFITHASERLRNDREIILQVINENGNSYKSLPYKFRKDRQIARQAAMKENVFHDLPRKLLSQDRAIALELVKRNGTNLGFLCSKFRHDREIVLEALRQDRTALKYVPYQLRESLIVSNN